MAKQTTETPNNEIIKAMLKENHITQWKLASVLLVHENTVLRALRLPLSEDKYNLYVEAINSIVSKGA